MWVRFLLPLFILVNYRYNKKNILSKIRTSKTPYNFCSKSPHFLRVLKYRSSLHADYNHLTNDFSKLKTFDLRSIKTTNLYSTWRLYFFAQLNFTSNTKWHRVKILTGHTLLSYSSRDLELSFYIMSFVNRSGYSGISGDKNLHDSLYDFTRPKRFYNFIDQEPVISALHSWCLTNFIKVAYRYLSKKVLLGIYIVSSSYFLTNDIYFPSVDNIKVFTSSCLTHATVTHNINTGGFNGNKKFLPEYYGYCSGFNRLGALRRMGALTRYYKLTSWRLKLIKSKFLLLKDYFKNYTFLKGPLVVSYFFKFFKKNRTLGSKIASDQLLRSLSTSDKIHSICKTFKLFRSRVKYFSGFESIYNPGVVNNVYEVSNKVRFTRKYLTNRPVLGFNASVYSSQSIFKSTKNALLRKCVTHSNIHFMPFCFKLAYFFNANTYLVTKAIGLGSNLIPNDNFFRYKLNKHIYSAGLNYSFRSNVTPWVYNTVIRFMEYFSGKKVCLEIYSFMSQAIDINYITLYKSWLPRFSYYERRLGHRFFLEEALQILHMGFNYQDSKLISSWLKSLIQRISFWKTRFIFRFIRYLFNNYFQYMFDEIGVKGFKVRLKGKISVAGNSRKRSILYRIGKTSHTAVGLKVVHTMDTITTFTGVMGFQVWIFY